MPSSRLAMYSPSAREMAATRSTALTGTACRTDTRDRNAGSCRSRAIANNNLDVATCATRLFATPQASAVATAVSVASQAPPATSAAS